MTEESIKKRTHEFTDYRNLISDTAPVCLSVLCEQCLSVHVVCLCHTWANARLVQNQGSYEGSHDRPACSWRADGCLNSHSYISVSEHNHTVDGEWRIRVNRGGEAVGRNKHSQRERKWERGITNTWDTHQIHKDSPEAFLLPRTLVSAFSCFVGICKIANVQYKTWEILQIDR